MRTLGESSTNSRRRPLAALRSGPATGSPASGASWRIAVGMRLNWAQGMKTESSRLSIQAATSAVFSCASSSTGSGGSRTSRR